MVCFRFLESFSPFLSCFFKRKIQIYAVTKKVEYNRGTFGYFYDVAVCDWSYDLLLFAGQKTCLDHKGNNHMDHGTFPFPPRRYDGACYLLFSQSPETPSPSRATPSPIYPSFHCTLSISDRRCRLPPPVPPPSNT